MAAPVCRERCTDEIDIVFVLDSSSSVGANNFATLRQFVISLIERFRFGHDGGAQFAAIRYNRMVDDLFDFNNFSTQAEVLQAVRAIPYNGVGTLTGNALNYTRENKLTPEQGRRPNVPLMVVVLTDGVSSDDVVIPSELLKADNSLILAIGIANVNITQLNIMGSDPDEDFVTTVENFDALNDTVESNVERIRLCQTVVVSQECPENPMIYLVFVVDGLSSVRDENFILVQYFVEELVENFFRVEQDAARVTYVRYNETVDKIFTLNTYNTTEEVVQAIRRVGLPYMGQGTRTGQALRFTANTTLRAAQGRSPGDPAVVVVITDGKSQDEVAAAARRLRMRTQVIAVGIRGAVESELEELATQESEISHVFIVREFADLQTFEPQISLAECFVGRSNNGS